jgi:hypothetical protein
MVAVSGYLSDIRVLYCPTGRKFDQSIGRGSDDAGQYPAHTDVANIKRLGGVDGRSLTHGDISWAYDPHCWWEGHAVGVSLGCSYAYRNATFVAGNHTHVKTSDGRWLQPIMPMRAAPYRIREIWPGLDYPPPYPQYVPYKNTCPPFKTQRVLGGRSVIADRFGKAARPDLPTPLGTVIPGDGIFAHRQGYNVLYGDGSARWQGDPQGTLIWMTLPVGPHGGIDTPYGTNCTAIANPDQLSYGVGIFNVFDDDVYPNSVWNGRRW